MTRPLSYPTRVNAPPGATPQTAPPNSVPMASWWNGIQADLVELDVALAAVEARPAGGVTPGAMWVSIAAANAPAVVKARADYVCTGSADQNKFIAAYAVSDHIVFSEGDYSFSGTFHVNRTGSKLVGAGPDSSIINGTSASVVPIRVGSFQAVGGAPNNTKVTGVILMDFSVKVPTAGAVDGNCCVDIWGVSKSEFRNVTAEGGYDCWRVKNLDRFNFLGCDALGQVNAAWHLFQGVWDDVTIGTWTGGSGECNAANTVGILFDTFANTGEVASDANEFNRITFQGFRIGGSATVLGTKGLYFKCGARATSFQACQFRYNRTQIDATYFTTAGFTTHRLNIQIIGCSAIGTSANPSDDIIRYAGPASNYAHIKLFGFHVDRAVDVLHVDAGNPMVTFDGVECGGSTNITNIINVVAGSPRLLAPTPVILGTTEHRLSKNSGQGTILAGQTSVVVTHGLWKAPSTFNIHLQPRLGNPSPAKVFWVTNVTATTFTINSDAAVTADSSIAWVADLF